MTAPAQAAARPRRVHGRAYELASSAPRLDYLTIEAALAGNIRGRANGWAVSQCEARYCEQQLLSGRAVNRISRDGCPGCTN